MMITRRRLLKKVQETLTKSDDELLAIIASSVLEKPYVVEESGKFTVMKEVPEKEKIGFKVRDTGKISSLVDGGLTFYH